MRLVVGLYVVMSLTSVEAAPPSLLRRSRAGTTAAISSHHSKPVVELRAVVPPPEYSSTDVTRARLLLLLSGVIYGTYTVIIRALKNVGGEPLPAIFVTFVRYQFLTGMAFSMRAWRSRQARRATGAAAASTARPPMDKKLWLAAFELAFYTVISSLLSIFGTGRVPAVLAEILMSTIHVFVPLQTLLLIGNAGFGAMTWCGCLIAFLAAVVSCVADSGASSATSNSGGGADLVGQVALVLSSAAFGLFRVRTQVHLRRELAPEALNLARMVAMGALSVLLLVLDVLCGGGSRKTLTRLQHVLPMQWLLMALSVFLSAFVASALSFSALKVIPAANAQPFAALQPVFCAMWSMLLLSEPISLGAMLGGGMMIGATLLACADKTAS